MLRIIIAVAAIGLLAGTATAQDKSVFSNAQKDEIRKLVREYILANPEIITEAIDVLQAKEEQAKEAKQAAVIKQRRNDIFNSAEGTVIGNPKGDVTIVEFFDYNCGYCKSLYTNMMDTLKEDNKIRLVLKEFPILGPSSMTAAKAALAARKQNKYAEVHLALLGHRGSLNDASIMEIAKKAGADVKKLQEDMKDPEITSILSKNHELAASLDITGTPAMFIGDTFIPGAIDKATLKEHIAAARKK